MRTVGGSLRLLVALAVLLETAVPAAADNNPNGIVFRAVGWFKGKEEITAGRINCEIPNVTNAITEGSFSYGLWNTYGRETLFFPDRNHEFGNPCGGWIQLQNNLLDQGITVERIRLRFRIPGSRRLKQLVQHRRQLPAACVGLKQEVHYNGARLNPVNSTQDTSSSGVPNVAFIQMLPMVTPELIHCLRDSYTGVSTSFFTSVPLVIAARAYGISDAGDSYVSNTIQYTLTLRHTCGNGRVDDGEVCDPNGPSTCVGLCAGGKCSQNDLLACVTDADCAGACMPQDSPSECLCVY